jgi:bud site selection protein 20
VKDLDQIQDEMKKPIPLPFDETLPGMGQYYCMACARYFINRSVLSDHCKTTAHKRQLKLTLEKPYSIREAEAAAGMAPPAK